RDIKTGRVSVTALRDDGLWRIEDNGIEVGGSMRESMSIGEDDPLTAETEMERTILLGRGSWRTRIVATARPQATRENFLSSARLEAYEGETRIFAQDWSTTIPRDSR